MLILRRFFRFLDAEAAGTGLPVPGLLVAALTIHVVVTLVGVNPWHPDEQFQILELAWSRYGLSGDVGLPWEFEARIRQSLQPLLAMGVLGSLRALGVTSPFTWVLALRLGTLLLAFGVLLWTIAHVSPGLSRAGRRTLWFASFFLWFTPLFFFRFTSENLGGMVVAAAIPLLASEEEGSSTDAVAGALLGLGFLFRFQMAFGVLALLLWLGLLRPRGWVRAARVTVGAGMVVLLGLLGDAWFYGAWVITPWEYFRVNLIEGVASTFGVSPWYSYFVWLTLWATPFLGLPLVLLASASIAVRPRSPWVWAGAALLIGHSLIGHKEVRFVFPLLFVMPVLVAITVDAWWPKLGATRLRRAALGTLVVLDLALLLALMTPSIHRGKEFDGHYLRFLWDRAAANADRPVFVLDERGEVFRAWGMESYVYRHPALEPVRIPPGEDVRRLVPTDTPAGALLLVTRESEPPELIGVDSLSLEYMAEPGYRVMARWVGLDHIGALEWLERVDRWSSSHWVRRVYRVHLTSGPL